MQHGKYKVDIEILLQLDLITIDPIQNDFSNEDILNGLIEIEYSEDSYIIYLDANNLYGYAMCQYLPTSDFKWDNEEWNLEKI